MTIKDLYMNGNILDKTYVTIWDRDRNNLLYCGTIGKITYKMLDWKVWFFRVVQLEIENETTYIKDLVIMLENGEEKR